jgi:hypothetical protein
MPRQRSHQTSVIPMPAGVTGRARAKHAASLLRNDRRGSARSGYRIGVTMDDPPSTIFTPEDGGHAKRNWCKLIGAADLGSELLKLDYVRQIRCSAV